MMRADFKSSRKPESVGFTQDGQCIYGNGNEAVRDECVDSSAGLGLQLILFYFIISLQSEVIDEIHL